MSGIPEMLQTYEIPGAPDIPSAPEIPGVLEMLSTCEMLMRYSALLLFLALSGTPKFTFAQALDEGEIMILLISTIYNIWLGKNKGDER
jgi:hypothetical protein